MTEDEPKPKPQPNQTVERLRITFNPLVARLRPEDEPATEYKPVSHDLDR